MPQDEIKKHPREPQRNLKTQLFRVGFAVNFLILSRYDVSFRNVFSNTWLSWRTYWPFCGPWAALGQLSGGYWPVLGFLFWAPYYYYIIITTTTPPLLRLSLLLLHPTTIISTFYYYPTRSIIIHYYSTIATVTSLLLLLHYERS